MAAPVPLSTSQLISSEADAADSVYAGDVDGDGDLDVMSAALFDDTIAWHENQGGQLALPTLRFAPNLGDSGYRLLVCDSLEDAIGSRLAEDHVVTFRQDAKEAFANGHVDCGLGGWMLTSTTPDEITFSTEDVDDSLISGSAHITNLSGSDFSIRQCVNASVPAYRLRSHIRVEGAAEVRLRLTTGCTFYSQSDCLGSSLEQDSSAEAFADTAGAWLPSMARFEIDGASSAFCSFDLSLFEGMVFNAYLDALTLPGTLFSGGFESGDLSAWSAPKNS